jgi:uncharacterized membrane protein
LGLVLRLISLNQSLWLDEATSALVAKMPLTNIFTKFLPGDFHPPLYYLILKLWTSIFGFSEVSLRIPSIVFGIGVIYVTYLIAKKIFNENTALISSVLLATSGLAVYYSQEARMYSMAAFLVALLVYFFIEKKWTFFSIILVLVGMTDYVSLLILPVFWIFGKKDFKKLLLAHVPLILAFGLWSPIFISQIKSGFSISGSNWWQILGTASFKNIALIPIKFILGRISFDNKIVYALIAIFVSVLYFGLSAINILRRPCKGNPCKVILVWLVIPIFFGIVLSLKIPTLSYFRFLFCLPALYILVAGGIEKLGKYKKIFLCLVILINLLCTLYYVLTPRFQREDWRSATGAIGTDTIVLPATSQGEALEYYGKGSQIAYSEDFKGGPKEVWLSRYVWQIFDSSDSARRKVEDLGYNKVLEYNFNGVVFDKYSK